jgi:hypothetical protein
LCMPVQIIYKRRILIVKRQKIGAELQKEIENQYEIFEMGESGQTVRFLKTTP